MRTLNIRLAAILAAVAVVFGTGIYFLHAFQVKNNARMFLDQAAAAKQRADEAAKQKDPEVEKKAFEEAVQCYRWYVRLMPDDVEIVETFGKMLADRSQQGNEFQQRMYFEAMGLLERTVSQDPERDSARRQLVKMYLFIRRFQDAKDHLQNFLLIRSPRDAELLEQLGVCQMQTGDFDKARDTFKKAIEYGPNQVTAYWQLASLLRSRYNQPKEADEWMDKLIAANPDSAQAHFLRGRYLLVTGSGEQALEEAEKALKLDPNDSEIIWLAAVCNSTQGKLDAARKIAQRGIELHPDVVAMYKTLSDIEKQAGDREKALAVLEQGLTATKRDPTLLMETANLLIESNKLDQARRVVKELQTAGVAKAFTEFLTARIELAQGHWLAARQGFEKIRNAQAVGQWAKQIDVWISQCYGQLGNRDQQLRALRRALSIDPTYAPAKAALIDVLMSRGQVAEALEEFGQLARRGGLTSGGTLALARMLLLQTLRTPPNVRDWTPTEKALEEAEKALPDAPETTLLRTEMLLAQERPADAEKLLADARAKNPKQLAFLNALIALAQRRGDWDQAEKLLKQLDEEFGDGPEQRLVHIQHLVRRYGLEAKEQVRKMGENIDKFDETQRLQLWGGLLAAAMQLDDNQQADALAKLIAEKQPDNVQIRYMIFERALAAEDRPAMEAAIKEIERVAGQGSYWLYAQAVLRYLDGKKDPQNSQDKLEEALRFLDKAREHRGDWSRIPLLMAGVYDALGKPDMALRYYQEALNMGDRNPSAIRRAILLLAQTQQFAEADRLLRQLEKEHVELSPEAVRAGAEVALQQGEFDRALEMARKAVDAGSKNYQDHLWLGQIMGILGSHAKVNGDEKKAEELLTDAEATLRKAVELEPTVPLTHVALIRFLSAMGKEEKAEKAIQEATLKLSAKDAPLALAQCYEVMNKPEEAEKKYEAALAAAPDDIAVVRMAANFYARLGKLIQAETQLQRIIDGKLKAEPQDVVLARRQLALIYAARGGYQNLQKAHELIEQNLVMPESSVIDRRVKARLDASDPTRARRDQAVRMFEEMLKEQAASPDDRFALIQMYLAAGDWIKASNQFRSLVATYPNEPRFLIAYIEAMLRQGEISSVEMYLDRLDKLVPNLFNGAALRADWLCATKQPEKALELLKGFVDLPDALPKDREARLRLTADKLSQLGLQLNQQEQKPLAEQFAAAAEKLYREYLQKYPEQELLLAIFFGTHGRGEEALDLIERNLDNGTPQDIAQICAHVMQRADNAVIARMRQVIALALQKYNRPVPLLLMLAEIATREKNYIEAENLYREVLKKNTGNAVAMNNLAVLLALQGLKLDEALELVNKAIEIAGPLGPMLDSRATVYTALGKTDEALKDIADALNDAETPVRLFHQALAYQRAGMAEAAKAAMKRAMKKGLTTEMLQPLELPDFEKLRPAATTDK